MLRNSMILMLLGAMCSEVVGQDVGRGHASAVIKEVSADTNAFQPSWSPSGAEPAIGLTLADLEGLALQNNPTLALSAAQVDAARGKHVQSGLYSNPVVGYHATEIGNAGTAGQQGAFFRQQIFTSGKRKLDQAIAGKEVDEAHFRLHTQRQRVLNDVRLRFYAAGIGQRRIELTKEFVRTGQQLVESTEKLLASGVGTENDLLQAQIRADELDILLDNATNHYVEAWRRLAAVVGIPELNVAPLDCQLDDNLPSYAWDECYALVLRRNPELSAARARADRARIVIQRAKREPIPDVDLMVSNRHHNVTGDNVTNVQVGIPLPVFNKNQGNVRKAHAEWITACQDIKRVELDLQERLAAGYREYADASQQVWRYRERMLPRASRSLMLVTNGYEKGQVGYLNLLTAQQTYLKVSLAYLDSLLALRRSAALIEGQLVSESLTTVH